MAPKPTKMIKFQKVPCYQKELRGLHTTEVQLKIDNRNYLYSAYFFMFILILRSEWLSFSQG